MGNAIEQIIALWPQLDTKGLKLGPVLGGLLSDGGVSSLDREGIKIVLNSFSNMFYHRLLGPHRIKKLRRQMGER